MCGFTSFKLHIKTVTWIRPIMNEHLMRLNLYTVICVYVIIFTVHQQIAAALALEPPCLTDLHEVYSAKHNGCVKCPLCDRGWGIDKAQKKLLATDPALGVLECATCNPCIDGQSYNDGSNRHARYCFPCQPDKCETNYSRSVKTPCIKYHDAICGECLPGFSSPHKDVSRRCYPDPKATTTTITTTTNGHPEPTSMSAANPVHNEATPSHNAQQANGGIPEEENNHIQIWLPILGVLIIVIGLLVCYKKRDYIRGLLPCTVRSDHHKDGRPHVKYTATKGEPNHVDSSATKPEMRLMDTAIDIEPNVEQNNVQRQPQGAVRPEHERVQRNPQEAKSDPEINAQVDPDSGVDSAHTTPCSTLEKQCGETGSDIWTSLLHFLKQKLGKDNLNFVRKLGVDTSAIEYAQSNHRNDVEEMTYQLLLSWRRMHPEATPDLMYSALSEIGRNDLGQDLRTYLNSIPDEPAP